MAKVGPRQEDIDKARGDLEQAQGQLAFAQSQLEATQIRAPVTGTILERTAEKGELVTAQFASTAEGGPQGSVVAIADLNDHAGGTRHQRRMISRSWGRICSVES